MFNFIKHIQVFMISTIMAAIYAYNSFRNRHYLTRSGLQHPKFSSWATLHRHADDGSFLHITGFSRKAFEKLKNILFGNEDPTPSRGRPPLLDNTAKLGLYLLWAGSTMKTKQLCLQFGVIESTANDCISDMRSLVIEKLMKRKESRVRWPTREEMEVWAAMVQLREPSVETVIGFVDGLFLPCQCSDRAEDQFAFYSGKECTTGVNNVLAFSPFGKCFYALINYPGSWHDSSVAQPLADKAIRDLGIYQLCVDQGFGRSGELFDKFVGPLSKKAKRSLSPIVRDLIIRRHEVYVSLRQAAEWGMRALQGTFCRLKSRLMSDVDVRHDTILSCILLHNFRTHEVGLNQIATVFNPEYEQFINIEGYDRISNYF